MDMDRRGIAIVVEDGVQVQQPRQIAHQAVLGARKRGSRTEQGGGASFVVSSSVLDFFWRIFERVAGYVTRIRRFFVFKLAKDGSLQAKEERRISKSENKVEEGLVKASRVSEPELGEIIVSQKETTDHGIHDVDTKVVEVYHEDSGSECTTESKDMDEDSAPLACIVEHAPGTEQSTSDPSQQGPPSVTCEPVNAILPELHGEDCTANTLQKCNSTEQNASQGEELVEDVVISNKSDTLQVLSQLSADNSSLDNSLNSSSNVESLEFTSSPTLKRRFSIQELNAVVAEQLTKYLHTLERNMVPGKAEHRRAIILATIVAVVVWARNSKHLHESMPRIMGSAINVHIRSRL